MGPPTVGKNNNDGVGFDPLTFRSKQIPYKILY